MDQLPININITLITGDVDMFIQLLNEGGFKTQADAAQVQWDAFNNLNKQQNG